jgi:hypothetical protein
MADLKNSQRINYKATYVQLKPTPADPKRDGRGGKAVPSRAIEKAAFVQSLAITQHELRMLKEKAGAPALKAALHAVEALVSDKTATSTLNNAPGFATIAPETISALGKLLLDDRTARSDAIAGHLSKIVVAYRALTVEARKAAPAAPAPTGPKTELATNSAGIVVKKVIAPVAVTKKNARAKVATVSQTGRIGIDESRLRDIAIAAQPAATATSPVSPRDAIAWAERNQPKFFADLNASVRPYLALSDNEIANLGMARALSGFFEKSSEAYFNVDGTKGAMAGFTSRMHVEPVGNLHLERIEMYPVGIERGELVHSIPLAPGETVNVSHKEWAVSQQEFEEIVQDYFEGYSEQGVAEKNDISMSTESQSKHATALSVGASLSASYSSVTLSTSANFNLSTNDDQSRKDSRNHSATITKKASARTKKDHKVTFKVTSVTGSEDEAVRVINNPSDTDAMRVDYFQLARKWKVNLLRYGIRMTYDIVIPNPGSALVTKVKQLQDLDAEINVPFSFTLPLSSITYNPYATDPNAISNYAQLAAQFDASVTAPPEVVQWVNVHKETPMVSDYDNVHYDSIEFDIDEHYYISDFIYSWNYQNKQGDTSVWTLLNGSSFGTGLSDLIGKSGKLSLDFVYQYVHNYGLNITFQCRPKGQVVADWRLQAWNQMRQAAEDNYNKSIQHLKDLRAQVTAEIEGYDALTLRRMEQEEIMKGVLRWIFGPSFDLVPFDISWLFSNDSNDPEVTDVLDPNQLTNNEWARVMEHGEFIKYLHNAIEWENVLYFTYPYFWDDTSLWDFKKFIYHPDPTHRVFLRSGAARVVLTIRPGFEPSFTQLVETGAFNTLPGPHPYVTIAQEIQDYANTNYPGFPPANPAESVRPQLYFEQRRVWREMQYAIQLLDAFRADPANNGAFPTTAQGLAVLQPYVAGVNATNTNANTQALTLDPTLTPSDLLPTYTNVPVKDLWGNPYVYKSPGDTGDYDLVSCGADGQPGGADKDADIAANAEASLIATWYEYTATNALDIGITMNKPNLTPPDVKPDIG